MQFHCRFEGLVCLGGTGWMLFIVASHFPDVRCSWSAAGLSFWLPLAALPREGGHGVRSRRLRQFAWGCPHWVRPRQGGATGPVFVGAAVFCHWSPLLGRRARGRRGPWPNGPHHSCSSATTRPRSPVQGERQHTWGSGCCLSMPRARDLSGSSCRTADFWWSELLRARATGKHVLAADAPET